MSFTISFRIEFPTVPSVENQHDVFGILEDEILDVSKLGVAAYLHRSARTKPIRRPLVTGRQVVELAWENIDPRLEGLEFPCLNVLVYGQRVNPSKQQGMVLVGGARLPWVKLLEAKAGDSFPLRDTTLENKTDATEDRALGTAAAGESLHETGRLVLERAPDLSVDLKFVVSKSSDAEDIRSLMRNLETLGPIGHFQVNDILRPHAYCPELDPRRVPKWCKYGRGISQPGDAATLKMYNDIARWTWETWLSPGDDGHSWRSDHARLVMDAELLCQVVQRVAFVPYFFDRHWDGRKMKNNDTYFSLRLIPDDTLRCGDCDDISQEMMRVFGEIAMATDEACEGREYILRLRQVARQYHAVSVECVIASEGQSSRPLTKESLQNDTLDTCGMHVFCMFLPRDSKKSGLSPCVLESTDMSLSYTNPSACDRLAILSSHFASVASRTQLSLHDGVARLSPETPPPPIWPDLSNYPFPYEAYKKQGFYRGTYCLNLGEASSDEFDKAVILTFDPPYIPIACRDGLAEKGLRAADRVVPVTLTHPKAEEWHAAYVRSLSEPCVPPFTSTHFEAVSKSDPVPKDAVVLPYFWRTRDEHLGAARFVERLKEWAETWKMGTVRTGVIRLGACSWSYALVPLVRN